MVEIFILIILFAVFALGMLVGSILECFSNNEPTSIGYVSKITYCVYERVNKDKQYPQKKIATGLTYSKACKLYRKSPSTRNVYSDI